MLRLLFACAALLLASSAVGANTCETIRSQIDAKIRAAGVAHYTLTTIDTDAKANGKVVGTCDQGKKKIVYLPSNEAMLTECKDGSVSVGGECKK